MALIAGVSLAENKKVKISLMYIRGIGPANSLKVCQLAGVDPEKRLRELGEEGVAAIRKAIAESGILVEGDLQRKVANDIKALQEMGCYRGVRHWKRLPCHGQRTRTNARTRKGRRSGPVPGKKKVTK